MSLKVLVETYWNVNKSLSVKLKSLTPVLVETYWNVNSSNCVF